MQVIKTISHLKEILDQARASKKSIGFVPTMGALHEGHASLVRQSVLENDITVVSIFLNPTQFNDPKDLERYPRTLVSDCELLEKCGAQIAFAPSVEEVYPETDTRTFSYPPTDTVMEGEKRPGHFNGVCQIVSKLFYITNPDNSYFGEKDYQQIAVIRRMVEDLRFKTRIIPCPVIREENGLAMSSRNTLLTKEEKNIAANIYKVLSESKNTQMSLKETESWVTDKINSIDGLVVEYFNIVNGLTLASIDSWNDTDNIVGCITVYCGKTPIRLIDHIRYK
ncbi:MAG: pantoate--beta-alanine ligase [Bacteroidaceae bacterium]|jgi:pantoate--beta-alanine ligase|nr:pantoate--beta-alanine ligase [Bacteroidaceae bacterium]